MNQILTFPKIYVAGVPHLCVKISDMTFNATQLLHDLAATVRQQAEHTRQLQKQPTAVLETPPAEGAWSATQVYEHLNVYCRHYLPAIEAALAADGSQPKSNFNTGWLGLYFTNMMQPTADGTLANKMQSPKNAVPPAKVPASALAEFVRHQEHMLRLIALAEQHNIGRVRIPISISRWVRLKLGDTFRFVIAHQYRHFLQIDRCVAAANSR